MVKQLIYDSCMIVEMRTIIAVYLDIQPSHKKHDGMMVVSKSTFITIKLDQLIFQDGMMVVSKSTFIDSNILI